MRTAPRSALKRGRNDRSVKNVRQNQIKGLAGPERRPSHISRRSFTRTGASYSMGQAYPQVDGGVRLNRTERDASQRRGGRLSDYQSLVARISSCTKCTLSRGRNKTVPGDGALDADFMFIGEGPGFHEDRQGLPFVGQAGNLLNEMLALIGLARGDVYITNMIKCRPPNNRDPFPVEISSCRPYLDEQIEMIESQGDRDPGPVLVFQVLSRRGDRQGEGQAAKLERAGGVPDVPSSRRATQSTSENRAGERLLDASRPDTTGQRASGLG